jgi:hypothetical protein
MAMTIDRFREYISTVAHIKYVWCYHNRKSTAVLADRRHVLTPKFAFIPMLKLLELIVLGDELALISWYT